MMLSEVVIVETEPKTFKLKVHQFCSMLRWEKGLTSHVRWPTRLYLLSDNGDDVQYFCRVREEQLSLYLIFTSIKMHIFGK